MVAKINKDTPFIIFSFFSISILLVINLPPIKPSTDGINIKADNIPADNEAII